MPKPAPNLPEPSSYPVCAEIRLRYCDHDVNRHFTKVNMTTTSLNGETAAHPYEYRKQMEPWLIQK